MTNKPKTPVKPVAAAVFAATVPAGLDTYLPGDALPTPEVIEKDSDSVWELWSDAVAKDAPKKEREAQPSTLLMGLHELPKDPDA